MYVVGYFNLSEADEMNGEEIKWDQRPQKNKVRHESQNRRDSNTSVKNFRTSSPSNWTV